MAQLRQVVGALDRERDALVAEADQRAEELARLRSGAADKEAAAAELEGRLATAQEQAASQAELLAAADADRAALRRKEEAATVQEERLRAEALAQEAELAATADDLRKMIRENQVLNEELQRSGGENTLTLASLEAKIRQLEHDLAEEEAGAEQLVDEICDIVSLSISATERTDIGVSVSVSEFCRMLLVWEQYRHFYNTLDSLKQGLIFYMRRVLSEEQPQPTLK